MANSVAKRMEGVKVSLRGEILVQDMLVIKALLWRDGVTCTERNALLHVSSRGKADTFCITHIFQHQLLPVAINEAEPSVLFDLSQSKGCTLEEYPPRVRLANSTVGLLNGSCGHAQKSSLVQMLNGRSVLIIETDAEANLPSNSTEHEGVNIPVATIAWDDYRQLFQHKRPVVLRMYAGQKPPWDPNMIIVVLLSTALVMVGAGWAARKEHKRHQSRKLKEQGPRQASELTEQKECSRKLTSVYTVVTCVTLPSAMIVLLYFCYAQIVYFVIGIFCFFGSLHLYQCLLPLWSRIVPVLCELDLNKVPCIKTKLKLRNLLLYLPCLSLGIFWAVQRHATYAWLIQDLLGASLCIVCVKNVRVSSARTLVSVLAFFVAYDVFFVFITPLITKDGDSIMMRVATGASSHMDSELFPVLGPPKENLPIMFLIPLLSRNPMATCGKRVFSILGLGDVFIPGLLVTYSSVFDVRSGTKMVYYLASSLGYFCGIVICMITLVVTGSGQPALMYLIPCTLLATMATALVRGELRKLMQGSPEDLQTIQELKANGAAEDETVEEEEDSVGSDKNKLVS